MPHNHSPRCCCEHTYNGAIVTSAANCPSCVEHGELATLGNNAPIADTPDEDEIVYCLKPYPASRDHYWCRRPAGHDGNHETSHGRSWSAATTTLQPGGVYLDGRDITQLNTAVDRAQTGPSTPDLRSQIASRPAECPSCHAVGDQPHTDYCQLPLTNALRLANAQTSQPAEYTISQPDRGTGWSHQHPDGQRWHHVEGETCTEGNAMPEFARAVQAQTSQPTATTSQPPTHTRAPSGPITSGQPYTLKRGEGILTHLEHAMPGGRTHLRALCRPDICGQQPTPSQ